VVEVRGPQSGGVGLLPIQQTVARIMAVIEVGEVIWFVPAALAAAVPPVSLRWLAPILVGFSMWSLFFAWVAAIRGLASWLVAGDVLVTIVLCVLNGRLVPVAKISDGSGWVASVASLCVVGLPLAWRAWFSVPVGAVVVAVFAAGYPLAGYPTLGRQHTGIMAGQLVASAVVMMLVRHTSRQADAAFAASQEAQRLAAVHSAGVEDEAAQLRLLHDTAVTTLTLLGTNAIVSSSERLARSAAASLAAIEAIPESLTSVAPPTVSLDELLATTARDRGEELAVRLSLQTCRVPFDVASAFAAAVEEALRNCQRHAGVGDASVELRLTGDRVEVEIADAGAGFEPELIPPHRFGIRGSIVERMVSVGGSAVVESAPGGGTRWVLVWSDGIHD
jgi:signal transduction histidine kinase